jgi:hypothetical protein|eukprot:COSAG01_NODE_29380_length_639_cov_1.031481_1_plen_102_part_00
MTVAVTGPPKVTVEIVRMSRGKRMTESKFASLSEKEQQRVLRNRRNALKTRSRRQGRLKALRVENAILEAENQMKQQQLTLLKALVGAMATATSANLQSQS